MPNTIEDLLFGDTKPKRLRPVDVTGPAVRALHDVLQGLEPARRDTLLSRLRAAYLEDAALFARLLPERPLAVESVRRWRKG